MYQPVMSEENVRRLYFLKLERRRPMTKLLDEILDEYFEQHNRAAKGGNGECTNAKYAETCSKSSGPEKDRTVTISGTATAHSAESGTTP